MDTTTLIVIAGIAAAGLIAFQKGVFDKPPAPMPKNGLGIDLGFSFSKFGN